MHDLRGGLAVEEQIVCGDLGIYKCEGVLPHHAPIDEVKGAGSVGAEQAHAWVIGSYHSQSVGDVLPTSRDAKPKLPVLH